MSDAWFLALDLSIVCHAVLAAVVCVPLVRARTVFDRLVALDLLATLLLAVIVLLAVRLGWPFWLDVALGFAAVGFTGTLLLTLHAAAAQEGGPDERGA